MTNDAPPAVDLSLPVTDDDSRARFALIAAGLEALVTKTDGDVREGLLALLEIARSSAGAALAPSS